MPELPEVEHTARQLRATIIGAIIHDVQVFWQRTIGYPALDDFLARIAGQRIEGVRRRGKFLLLDLKAGSNDAGCLLTIHRRMSGNLFLLPAGWEVDSSLRKSDPAAWERKGPVFKKVGGEEVPAVVGVLLAYCRVCFNLTDGRRLLFTDPRKFGRIELWPREQEEEALAGLGMEPLDASFSAEGLMAALAGRKGAIKQILLAQEVIAGIGNIYADEALFYAGIHPLRQGNSLTTCEVRRLHEGIVSVLTRGIEHGGTSFNDYRDLWGEAGENYDHVSVYQKAGQRCLRCGTLIERIVVGQRGTHFCPACQKLT